MILPAVFALLNVPAVTALIGTNPVRAYHREADDNAVLPYVVWSVVGGAPEPDLDHAGMDNHRVQVDCWAADGTGCNALALVVRDAMENDGENVMVSFNGDDKDPDTGACRWSMDFSIWTPRE